MTVHLTYGPPGCGKTTDLEKLARRIADQRGGKEVLIASLTRAAAAEIGLRDTGVPADHCGTLHSICYHALGCPTVAEGKAKDWNQAYPQWSIATQSGVEDEVEASLEMAHPSPGFDITGDQLLASTQLFRAQMVPVEEWHLRHNFGRQIVEFHEAWTEWKDDCGHLDFTDLIEQAIVRHPTVPKRASVLLFDEAQDYSKLEATLCQSWAEEASHTVFVGDPDQSLYEWRGADARMFMDMDVEPERKRVLGQSYRVPRHVCEYATRWIRQISDREDVEYASTLVEGEIEHTQARWGWPGDVLPFIEQAEAGDESLMILTSCNYMLQPITALLRTEGVRFHNPYRRKNGSWNPIKRGQKKRISAFDRVEALANLVNERDHAKIQLWLDPLKSEILTKGSKQRAKNLEVGLDHASLRDLFVNESDFINAMDVNLDWYCDNITASKSKPFTYPRQVMARYAGKEASTSRMLSALQDDPKVIIGTCHSVKGGEADNVLVFPDISRAASDSIYEGGFDAVCRQFYVGLTRTKRRLYLGKAMYGRRHSAVEWL